MICGIENIVVVSENARVRERERYNYYAGVVSMMPVAVGFFCVCVLSVCSCGITIRKRGM